MPNLRKSHCLRGHERLPETLKKSGACKVCIREDYLKGIGGRYRIRGRTECKKGHPLVEGNLDKNNRCRQCPRERSKAWHINHPYSETASRRKYAENNRAKIAAKCRKYRLDNPNAVANTKLLMRYGITYEERNAMIVEQNNLCAICGLEFDGETNVTLPFVDHDHCSKKVRGILCHHCNAGIGHFKDNCESLLKAVQYLHKYQQ